MNPIITTTGLTKRYKSVTALNDCTVTVPEGRICALIGPNGAGKTTLLRLLAGQAQPASGTASVLGSPPREDPAFLADIAATSPRTSRCTGGCPRPTTSASART